MRAASTLLAGMLVAPASAASCDSVNLDFALLKGDAVHAAIEDDIAADLAKVGITVTPKYLEKAALNKAMVDGDYDMVFSESWGAPYDPHSYVSSWTTPDEAHYSAMKNLPGKLEPTKFGPWIDEILSETSLATRRASWKTLLQEVHEAVLHLPLYGKRIPSVISTRLSNYNPGFQQYDYPIHNIKVALSTDSNNIMTVAPGAQTGIFKSVGRLDPHSYRPNEFFANNWVYEGLTKYGSNGAIEPSLAESWTSSVHTTTNIETVTFTLRTGVKFHDGADWDCSVAKLNFDHVFAEPLKGSDWHGWYNLPTALASWSCDGNGKFVVTANKPYYPLLQELTFIRPLRMLSPNGFVNGADTSAITHNSCPTGWGSPACWDGAAAGCVPITCAGTKDLTADGAAYGTGPFKFKSRTQSVQTAATCTETASTSVATDTAACTAVSDLTTATECEAVQTADTTDGSAKACTYTSADMQDDLVKFEAHTEYWGGAPGLGEVHIQWYKDAAAVKAALDAPGGTCRETSMTPVATDTAACDAVSALTTATACEAVETADTTDGSAKACTYTPKLDAVIGAGPLAPADIKTLMDDDDYVVQYADPLMSAMVIMNSATMSKDVRTTVVHSVNKGHIIETELGGLEKPLYSVFPEAAPYCDIYLTPKFDYDFEKAKALDCGAEPAAAETDNVPVIALGVGCGLLLIAAGALYFKKNKAEQALYNKMQQDLKEGAVSGKV